MLRLIPLIDLQRNLTHVLCCTSDSFTSQLTYHALRGVGFLLLLFGRFNPLHLSFLPPSLPNFFPPIPSFTYYTCAPPSSTFSPTTLSSCPSASHFWFSMSDHPSPSSIPRFRSILSLVYQSENHGICPDFHFVCFGSSLWGSIVGAGFLLAFSFSRAWDGRFDLSFRQFYPCKANSQILNFPQPTLNSASLSKAYSPATPSFFHFHSSPYPITLSKQGFHLNTPCYHFLTAGIVLLTLDFLSRDSR